ncbi:MAG TPA: PilZ domain-containing protein [Candidatus Acidoferrum sp.]|nr:PilZ domain-containing protein [Candidatus Acidoferrum sp.]
MTYNLERRQSARKRFENLLYVEVEPGNGGMVLNLSEHGFGFRAVKRVRPKQEVKFAFNLDEKRRVEGRGRLEWSDKEGRVAGVQFTEVSDEFLNEMRSWMANAVEYPTQSTGPGPSSSVPASSTATNGHSSPAPGSPASSESDNGHDKAAQAAPTKSVRSITSVSSTVAFPLAPEIPTESYPPETSNKRDTARGKWTSMPPAIGVERKPPLLPRMTAQAASDFAGATAYKLDQDVEYPDLSGDFELAEESNTSTGLDTQAHSAAAQDREDPLVSLEDRTARALNEHAQALLQHFQHEEQHMLATFREAAARALRDSERQLFPIREAAQAQMKSLESAVASAGASVKVLDRYPSLLERAQQQALDRFQSQVQEILHAHVMELRRRSEVIFEQINTQATSAGLLPGRIKTSSGIMITAVLVMLLIGLFVFRREAAGGFIWLGQQLVEPAPVLEPAKTSLPPPVQEAKPPAPEAKLPVPEAKSPAPEAKPPVPDAKPVEEPKANPANSQATPKDYNSRLQTIKSLWDEVAKGNVTSMLTLGNMYFTGHGVTKNCYQARRLFAAAARRGSLEGKQRLAELDKSTCPIVAP